MDSKIIQEYQKNYVLQSWSKQGDLNPAVITKAEGIYFYDQDGKKYFDMSSQLVNMNLGFGNKDIAEAIKAQVDQYCFVGPSYANEARSTLAKMIVDLLPSQFGKVFFTNAGAESNENAIKIARMYTGRHKIMSRYRSYHGSTQGAGNLTGEPRKYPLETGTSGFVKFFDPYIYREAIDFPSEEAATKYYLTKLREQIIYEGTDKIAAIFMETITGSNGVIIPPKGYLQGVREICDDYGIMMVCDEVMTGWCRTGKMFAFENFDVVPDIISFAKGVTCGYVPLGGVAVQQKIANYFDDNFLSCGLTYSGHPLACAAGVATVNYYLKHHIAEKVTENGELLKSELLRIQEHHPSVGEFRSIGLFAAIELVQDKTTKKPLVPYGNDSKGVMKAIIGKLKQRGFSTYSHENMILVCPPLIITANEIQEAMTILDEVLFDVDDNYLENNLKVAAEVGR
jgi:taurine--2-oxoglutarate transaminase